MFLGHLGLAFSAKKSVPAVSLGTLFLAAQFADLLWPMLLLLGVERVEVQPGATAVTPLNFVSYPYSHSLLALCLWSVLFGVVYSAVRRSRRLPAFVLALLVVSHWMLDYVTHRPDLQLMPGAETRVGLGLWFSVPGTLIAELALFIIGVVSYVWSTKARDRVGSIGLWSLVVFLFVVYLASAFGPPPPSVSAVALAGSAMWLLVVWGDLMGSHLRFSLKRRRLSCQRFGRADGSRSDAARVFSGEIRGSRSRRAVSPALSVSFTAQGAVERRATARRLPEVPPVQRHEASTGLVL